ncbi:hypothetical protein GGR48_000206 [Sphingomonas pseudosanguinis]|uniref:Uncharacterized protein n=2 Tax=Sphingomonas pseudosanguinis TaxID=413712 RepID=A0A7W6A934_9SPHN|nr:hypothetical protein [Sphingomonas pseudosanguinis]
MLKADCYVKLLSTAQEAFGAARQEAWDNMVGDAPIEEDQLFWLIDTALPRLEKHWIPLMKGSGISMRLSGVFCHKTPLAVYDDSKNPSGPKIRRELGDLLLVHDRIGRNAGRQALLMQAKRMENTLLKADNPEQARLYSEWPPFKLRGQGGNGSNFIDGDRHFDGCRDGVRYLIFDDARYPSHKSRCCNWCYCPWCDSACDHVNGWLVSDPRGTVGLPGSEDLATTFVNMLFNVYPPRGKATKRYLPTDTLKLGIDEDFDVTVHELLTKTFSKDLLTTKRGRHARRRGQETSFMGVDSLGLISDSPLAFLTAAVGSGTEPPKSERVDTEGEGGPIAIVLVETFAD